MCVEEVLGGIIVGSVVLCEDVINVIKIEIDGFRTCGSSDSTVVVYFFYC